MSDVRLMTYAFLRHRSPRQYSVGVRHIARMADSREVQLLDNRGFNFRLGVRRRQPGRARRGASRGRVHPGRALVRRNARSELCVCDLSWIVERAENLVSHHVRTLRTAGLVASRRDGKMVMYSLTERGSALLAPVLGGVAS